MTAAFFSLSEKPLCQRRLGFTLNRACKLYLEYIAEGIRGQSRQIKDLQFAAPCVVFKGELRTAVKECDLEGSCSHVDGGGCFAGPADNAPVGRIPFAAPAALQIEIDFAGGGSTDKRAAL